MASIFLARASALSLRFLSSSVSALAAGSSLFPHATSSLTARLLGFTATSPFVAILASSLFAPRIIMGGRSKFGGSDAMMSFVNIFLVTLSGDNADTVEFAMGDSSNARGMDRPLRALLSVVM